MCPSHCTLYTMGSTPFQRTSKLYLVVPSPGYIEVLDLRSIHDEIASGNAMNLEARSSSWWKKNLVTHRLVRAFQIFLNPSIFKESRFQSLPPILVPDSQ